MTDSVIVILLLDGLSVYCLPLLLCIACACALIFFGRFRLLPFVHIFLSAWIFIGDGTAQVPDRDIVYFFGFVFRLLSLNLLLSISELAAMAFRVASAKMRRSDL